LLHPTHLPAGRSRKIKNYELGIRKEEKLRIMKEELGIMKEEEKLRIMKEEL
jgi:hypothetical protein